MMVMVEAMADVVVLTLPVLVADRKGIALALVKHQM
jgi:hypothetical protein